MNLIKIGEFLQELRKEKGLTQEQLAEKVGVARRTVSRWETGSNMPDLDILMELSDLYSVDLREILNGERAKYWSDCEHCCELGESQPTERSNKNVLPA